MGTALGGLNVILTVFDGGLRLLNIIEEGIAWERKGKRDSQTTPCNPGGWPDEEGRLGRKESDSPLEGTLGDYPALIKPP